MKIPVAKATIMEITPYKPGESKVEGKENIIKLSSNESPFGPSPKAISAYKAAANQLHRYPDGGANQLRKAIGAAHDIDPERVVCGAGSDEIISLLCQAYTTSGKEVLYSQHGFLMYAIYAKAAGATPVEAPASNLGTNVDNILAHVSERTAIVFIANPNNPTGTYLTQDELLRLRKALPEKVLLVIDGAYAEYVEKEDYSNGRELVDRYDNVVMLRTFSKLYGLAALRIGWAYASQEIIDVLHRVRGPFNINAPAIAAASAAIEDSTFTEKVRTHNNRWLERFEKHFNAEGFAYYPSLGNFYLIDFTNKGGAEKADALLKENHIIARKVTAYGLPEYLRISIGLDEDNKKVMEVLGKL